MTRNNSFRYLKTFPFTELFLKGKIRRDAGTTINIFQIIVTYFFATHIILISAFLSAFILVEDVREKNNLAYSKEV